MLLLALPTCSVAFLPRFLVATPQLHSAPALLAKRTTMRKKEELEEDPPVATLGPRLLWCEGLSKTYNGQRYQFRDLTFSVSKGSRMVSFFPLPNPFSNIFLLLSPVCNATHATASSRFHLKRSFYSSFSRSSYVFCNGFFFSSFVSCQ